MSPRTHLCVVLLYVDAELRLPGDCGGAHEGVCDRGFCRVGVMVVGGLVVVMVVVVVVGDEAAQAGC